MHDSRQEHNMREPLHPRSDRIGRFSSMIVISGIGQDGYEPSIKSLRCRLEFGSHLIEVVHRGVEATDAEKLVYDRGAIALDSIFVPKEREERIDAAGKAPNDLF